MEKEVIITISGMQSEYERENPIKQTMAGEYYFRNGKHFLVYQEIIEGERGLDTNKCTMMITPEEMKINKRGSGNLRMNFFKRKKTITSYPTPFGYIMTSFYTHTIDITEAPEFMEVSLIYELEMNGSYMSECEIRVTVVPKNADSSNK